MQTVVIKLGAMIFPVILAYVLKKVGFFGPEDYRILSKIAINVTLPCAVVTSFASLEWDGSLLGIPVLAFCMNWAVLLYAWVTSRGIRDRKLRCLDMFSVVGFNMGNFMIPFASQFMGSTGVAVTALFDAGNSPMCTGGHYIFTTSVVRADGRKTTLAEVLRKLFSSPPLLVYILMILLMLTGLSVPSPLASVCELTGSANAFVSMFMMGLMFEIRFEPGYMKAALFVLVRKYLFSILAALALYFLLPFDLVIRQVLVLIAFAPIPSLAAIFTENIEGDVGLCSFITSCSYVISSVILTGLIFAMQAM